MAAVVSILGHLHPGLTQEVKPMNKPPRPCGTCGKPAVRNGRCRLHDRQAEKRRGSSTERGYGARHGGWFTAETLNSVQGMHGLVEPRSVVAKFRSGVDGSECQIGIRQ